MIILRPGKIRTATLSLIVVASLTLVTSITAQESEQTSDPRRLIRQSEKLMRAGSFAAAEQTLRRAVDIDTTSDSKVALAHVLAKRRQLGEAYELSYRVAEKEPRNARAFAVLGTVVLNAGRFKEARPLFVNAIRLNKKEDLAWAGIGLVDFYQNDIAESLDNLYEADFHKPDEPDYLFAIAQVASRAERYSEAANAYYRFLAASKDKDDERRARIKGLITFLRYLGGKDKLYYSIGKDKTVVPFDLVGNRPVIEVYLNGRGEKLRFVLDTGSGITVISKKTAKLLDVKSITKGGVAKGIGGDGKFEIVYGFVQEIAVGDAIVKNVPVYIREFYDSGYPVDGYIGLSLISKFLTTIDYGSKTFSLTRKSVDEAAFIANADLSLPLRLTSSGFLSGEVQLEGVDSMLNFIVDTGASVSVISDRVANIEAIGRHLSPNRLRVIGSAGVTDDVRSFLLPRVTFGSHSRQLISAIALDLDLLNEASGFEQAGILGGNFLKNYRVTFDFRNSKVTFVSVSPEQ